MSERIWGIDLGGTKIEGIVIDGALETVRERHASFPRLRVPTEGDRGYDHIVSQVVRLVESLEESSQCRRPARIGIGTPGNTNPVDGLLYHSNTQCLNGRPFTADLSRALGVEVVTANDANCLALAEARLGAARGYESMIGLILGTGVGGGLVYGGRLINGRHGIAGEWGQIVLDPAGPPSAYGTRGTVESYIAGPGLERAYEAHAGVRRKLPEIVERFTTGGDPAADATMDQLVERFAQSVSILINCFDPHAIVVGGGVGNVELIYSPRMREALQKHVFQKGFSTELLRPQLGDSAGVFGAAMLVA